MEEKNEKKKPMTIDDLVEVLKRRREKYGNLKVLVDTQDGGSYSLYGEDAVDVVESVTPAGDMTKSLQIG